MRKIVLLGAIATTITLTLPFVNAPLALAQPPASSGGGGQLGDGSGQLGDGSSGPAAGGAAMADFDTLMNLIQQTVDPDNWLAAGGESTMLPYPAGVFVSPTGKMQVVDDDIEVPALNLTDEDKKLHPWLTQAQSRVVSLRDLDQAILDAATGKSKPTPALTRLAGLARINYVKLDVENEDILLCGPSGDPAMGFLLEDLAVVAALINPNTAPLGCSIDPTDTGLRAVQALFQKPGAIKRLSRSPDTVAKEMKAALGPQKISIFGINPRSSTAIVLVDADAHMKKLGFGVNKVNHDIPTYFDYMNQQKSVPKQSMVRWWFAYDQTPIAVNGDHTIFKLPENVVTVMSEQQWMTAGGRAPSGGNDRAADAFAKGLSAKLPALRRSHPSYSRLCAVFETALALQLALDQTGQPDLKMWFPNLCTLGAIGRKETNAPKSLEGIATATRLKSGTVVAVVSGGVQADVASMAEENLEVSKFLSTTVIPDRPADIVKAAASNLAGRAAKAPAVAAWWWTGE